jgi:hypothetical protein
MRPGFAKRAVAVKAAAVAPEATVTLAGTLTSKSLLESATAAFPEAGPLSVTVQVDVPPLPNAAGLQLNDVTWLDAFGVAVKEVDTVPLVPET